MYFFRCAMVGGCGTVGGVGGLVKEIDSVVSMYVFVSAVSANKLFVEFDMESCYSNVFLVY